jgi:hypothetical protein
VLLSLSTMIKIATFPANYLSTGEMSPRLAPVLAHTFDGAPAHLRGIFAQDYMPAPGAPIVKRFAAINCFPAFVDRLAAHEADLNLYEILDESRPVYPYLDAEWDPAELDEESTVRLILALYGTCLREAGANPMAVSVYCASGPYAKYPSGRKASYHIIFETAAVFENTASQRAFFEATVPTFIHRVGIADLLAFGAGHTLAIDASVYKTNQYFRLPYQSKYAAAAAASPNRPLLPVSLPNLLIPTSSLLHVGVYEDPASLAYIRIPQRPKPPPATIPYNAPAKHAYELVEALAPLIRPTIFDGFDTTLKFIWAAWHQEQTQRMRSLIHKCCAASAKYSASWVDSIIASYKFKGITISTLIKWAKEGDPAAATAICAKYAPAASSHAAELFTAPIASTTAELTYMERYVRPLPADYTTIMLKSHLGTGKTTQISTVLAAYTKARVLIVSARKSYTKYLQGDLQKAGIHFTSYEEITTGHAAKSHLIIQLESLWKLFATKCAPYDLVIMDESESILNQLHSIQTNAEHLITNHQALETVVTTASKVILADAFLSERTITFATHLRQPDRAIFINNTYIPYNRTAIHLRPIAKDARIANIGGFEERILAALHAGRRVVVVWTSRSKGKSFARRFLECSSYAWRFYSSESTADQTAELTNVAAAWSSLQCLMMTTSITVGISYNPSAEAAMFDEAFLYGTSSSALPRDIAQALLRVRQLRLNRLTYVLDTRAIGRGVCGKEAVAEMLTAKEDRLTREHPVVKWTTAPPWVRDIHILNENEAATSKAEYRQTVERYLTLSGYELVEETHIPDNAIKAIKADETAPWDEIEMVDYETAAEIRRAMKTGDATADDIWEWKKWNFVGQFSSDCSEEMLSAWWTKFMTGGREKAFWNIVREKRWSVEQIAAMEGEARYAIMADGELDRRKALAHFLQGIGMAHSQEERTLTHEELVALGPKLEVAEAGLREAMGLRPSRRKGEWTIKNTMDLIGCVLDGWGCSDCESSSHQLRSEGKVIRKYTLKINSGNSIWPKIIVNSDILIDNKCMIK